jgi:K+ transporter
MLLLNYLGQAAYCLNLPAGYKTDSIFYDMVPKGFLIPAIVATVSTTIAKSSVVDGYFYTGERGD